LHLQGGWSETGRPLPLNRDADEERLARIEQMLEDLRRDVDRLNIATDNAQVRRDAIVTRENAARARDELQRAVATSRVKRRQRTTKKR
jgi:hypothetical protein